MLDYVFPAARPLNYSYRAFGGLPVFAAASAIRFITLTEHVAANTHAPALSGKLGPGSQLISGDASSLAKIQNVVNLSLRHHQGVGSAQ